MIIKYGECLNDDWGIMYAKACDNEMSYGEEARIDAWIDEQIWQDRIHNQIEKGIWIQKNGEEIHITNMTNSHIQNCINMLNRKLEKNSNNEYAELWIHRFKKELAFRTYIKNIAMGVFE